MILPSDVIEESLVTIGPGIYVHNDVSIPTVVGHYHTTDRKNGTVGYIESAAKRYAPQANDFVVGIVTGTIGESYKVQLQDYCQPVLLGFMAFANATKKNRPQLKNGQAVYARVISAIPGIDIEIECMDATGKESGFGPLDESGLVVSLGNLAYARELLFNHRSRILEKLAAKCAFEIAVGTNGRVWIKAGAATASNKPVKTGEERDKQEGEGGEGDGTANSTPESVADLRATLAAAKYLITMQHTRIENVDEVLSGLWKEYKVDAQG
ncbi:exosome complex component Rrp40p [Diutina catenulata]